MTAKKPLTLYFGRLSAQQASEGITAALENARALVKDAELLLEHGRWPRAAALAILAIEEAGKVPIIRSILVARDDEDRRDEWRDYRSHVKKNVAYILPDLARQGVRVLDDLAPIFDPGSDHGQVLDAVKQVAFYSEAAGSKCNWSTPEKAMREGFAKSMVAVARLMTTGDEPMSSVAELELWVKHLGPVWKHTPSFELKQALAACYAEAESMGVLRGKSNAREMTRFLFGITE